MSRRINPQSVLSEDEIAYLTDRGQFGVLAENAAYLITIGAGAPEDPESIVASEADISPESSETADSDESEANDSGSLAHVETVEYSKLKKDELQSLFTERNADRPENGLPLLALDLTANKSELVAALLADDAMVAARQ